ncbi:hypothetical protein OTU49_011494 [Cherax quadricarinatus]|uniref:Regulatory protein zeste n=1 Tax=Cherax quadricarinatus TaxID=27406 RepID=A0AAW0W332_CHEQU
MTAMEEHRRVGLQKRSRSRNFTKYEKEVFYAVFGHYAAVINNKLSTVDTVRDAWNRLLVEYNNQQGVYPRTRRQLQVMWRDEKFRAKKRGRKFQIEDVCVGQEEGPAGGVAGTSQEDVGEERNTANLFAPLLTLIKREHETYTAGESTTTVTTNSTAVTTTSTAVITNSTASTYNFQGGNTRSASHDHLHTTISDTSRSPDLHINSNSEEGPSSPPPLEIKMESCSSSPGPKMESRQDTEASPHNSQYSGTQVTLQAPQWLVNGTTTTTTSTSNSEEREREYHRDNYHGL